MSKSLEEELTDFAEFGNTTLVTCTTIGDLQIPTYVNEFWTSRQRACNSLHEISYRACFKPQLPHFFISRLTEPGAVVYDPFMGRGTTLIEAGLMGRVPYGNDVNPLSKMLAAPRLRPPTVEEVSNRLAEIHFGTFTSDSEDLLAFFHPDTLSQIASLRNYLLYAITDGMMDWTDRWIRMVALNRLTGHSNGFFSVRTLPPNQAVSPARQRLINAEHGLKPEPRDVPALIIKKTISLLRDANERVREAMFYASRASRIFSVDARSVPRMCWGEVDLVVTSPPFLDVVDYAGDNWLRCWFAGIEAEDVAITIAKKVDDWKEVMTAVLKELHRVVKKGGHVAFEVGEVRNGTIKLEEAVIPCGIAAGFTPRLVLINQQDFTKTANCWGVSNGTKGTNTNRVVLFRK